MITEWENTVAMEKDMDYEIVELKLKPTCIWVQRRPIG